MNTDDRSIRFLTPSVHGGEIKYLPSPEADRAEPMERLMQCLLNQPADELELIANALEHSLNPPNATEAEVVLATKLAGDRQFGKWERLALEFSSLNKYLERRQVLLEGALTYSQVADRLGKPVEIIYLLVERENLLGIYHQGEYLFPSCQFNPESPDGIVIGLSKVLNALKVGLFAKLSWLVYPNPFLDNLTPIDALKQGQIERVIAEARGVGVV